MKMLVAITAAVLSATMFGILPALAAPALPQTPRIFCQIGYKQVLDDCLKAPHGRVPPGQVRRELNPCTDRDDAPLSPDS